MSVATFHANMRAAVRQRLTALANLPPVAWEGRAFSPVKGVAFISEAFSPVSSVVSALGSGGAIAHRSLATFTLHYPPNAGSSAIDTMAGALLAHYPPGLSLTYAGQVSVVQQAERRGLSQEPDWTNVSVIITMVGHTTNI